MTIKQKIDKLFEPWQRGLCPGGQVLAVYKGKTVYDECFGYADIEHNVKINDDTVFHSASVSKQITSICALLLHERGQINVENDIRDYISELVAFAEPVTVRDMMNNISGIRDQWELQILSGIRLCDNISQRDLLTLIKRQGSLNFPPRSQYMYSNSNFTLLAEIVKKVSGMSLNDFAKKNVFEPLGMKSTFYRDKYDKIIPNRAMSYADCWDGSYLWKPLNYSNEGATSLHTTAKDFIKWVRHYRKPVICKKETMDLMLTVPKLTGEGKTAYACGVTINEVGPNKIEGKRLINHDGADEGYRASMLTFPDDELDIMILSNVENILVGNAGFRIARIILGIEEKRDEFDEKLYKENSSDIIEYLGAYFFNEMSRTVDLIKPNDEKVYFVMGEKTSLIKHQSGNCYDVVNSPFKLYITEEGPVITPGMNMIFKLGSLPEQNFPGAGISAEDLKALPGIYFSRETESYFEILIENGKLQMRQKRLGQSEILPIEENVYLCRLDYPIKFSIERSEGGGITGIKIIGGRITGIGYKKVNLT
ncbi:MAG: beta-lactamase family protein [Treponema sp.]|nr:beta-lactamase family protein [Treponema sp.]